MLPSRFDCLRRQLSALLNYIILPRGRRVHRLSVLPWHGRRQHMLVGAVQLCLLLRGRRALESPMESPSNTCGHRESCLRVLRSQRDGVMPHAHGRGPVVFTVTCKNGCISFSTLRTPARRGYWRVKCYWGKRGGRGHGAVGQQREHRQQAIGRRSFYTRLRTSRRPRLGHRHSHHLSLVIMS